MNDFWNNRSRPLGSILKMKPGTTKDSTTTPLPADSAGSSSQLKVKAASPANTPTSPPPPPVAQPAKSEKRAAAVHLSFDHDIACGVLAGVFEFPAMIVALEVVEYTNPQTNRTERTENWLRTNDMLAILIREYDKTRQAMPNTAPRPDSPPTQRSQILKQREEAVRRLNDLREQIACLLQSRRAYMKAEELGVKILVAPS